MQSGPFTTSDGVELHYLEVGAGPLLVFVPGWTMPARISRALVGLSIADVGYVGMEETGAQYVHDYALMRRR